MVARVIQLILPDSGANLANLDGKLLIIMLLAFPAAIAN
jgi:hypothetical protein